MFKRFLFKKLGKANNSSSTLPKSNVTETLLNTKFMDEKILEVIRPQRVKICREISIWYGTLAALQLDEEKSLKQVNSRT